MTTQIAPTSVGEGLRLLAHILDTTATPVPYHIGYCVLADSDAEGIATIDRIGLALEQAGAIHRVEENDYARTIKIELTDQLQYEIVYVFKIALDDHRARQSYYNNIG